MNYKRRVVKGLTEGWPATPADTPARVEQWARRVARYMEETGRSPEDVEAFKIHYRIHTQNGVK